MELCCCQFLPYAKKVEIYSASTLQEFWTHLSEVSIPILICFSSGLGLFLVNDDYDSNDTGIDNDSDSS